MTEYLTKLKRTVSTGILALGLTCSSPAYAKHLDELTNPFPMDISITQHEKTPGTCGLEICLEEVCIFPEELGHIRLRKGNKETTVTYFPSADGIEACLFEESGRWNCVLLEKPGEKARFRIEEDKTVVKYDLEEKAAEKNAKEERREVEKSTTEASCSDYVDKIKIFADEKSPDYEPERVIRLLDLGGSECYQDNSGFKRLVDELAVNANSCKVKTDAISRTSNEEILGQYVLDACADNYEDEKCDPDGESLLFYRIHFRSVAHRRLEELCKENEPKHPDELKNPFECKMVSEKSKVVKYDLEGKVAGKKVKKKTRQVKKSVTKNSCSDYVRKVITEKAKSSSYEPDKVVKLLDLGGGKCYRNDHDFREIVDKLAVNSESWQVKMAAIGITSDRDILTKYAERGLLSCELKAYHDKEWYHEIMLAAAASYRLFKLEGPRRPSMPCPPKEGKKRKQKAGSSPGETFDDSYCSPYAEYLLFFNHPRYTAARRAINLLENFWGSECYQNNSEFKKAVDGLIINSKSCEVKIAVVRITENRELLEDYLNQSYHKEECVWVREQRPHYRSLSDSLLKIRIRERLKKLEEKESRRPPEEKKMNQSSRHLLGENPYGEEPSERKKMKQRNGARKEKELDPPDDLILDPF